MKHIHLFLLHALSAASLAVASHLAIADTVMFGVFDGQKYPPEQLGRAARTPIQSELPRLNNGMYFAPRAADGHYYIAGSVNGFPVVFLVDTGATHTVIPLSLAANAGIRAGRQAVSVAAGGEVTNWVSEGNVVGVGPFSVKNSVVALAKDLRSPLLGVDLLNKFQVTYANGYMVLKIPN